MDKGEVRSTITSTTGGVMTEEVGAVTGDLKVATRLIGTEAIQATVGYAGAEEWYTVEGSPIRPGDVGSPPLSELHERVVGHLTMPGEVVAGNEEPTSLHGFSP